MTWAYVSETASDRPSPDALAKAAVTIACGVSGEVLRHRESLTCCFYCTEVPCYKPHLLYFGLNFFFFTIVRIADCNSRESTVPLDSHVKPFELSPSGAARTGGPKRMFCDGCPAL